MKIAIFAGHGRYDSGARGNGYIEKEVNLEVSNSISDILKSKEYKVVNNRTTDIYTGVNNRAAYANSQKVDAVIELHMNSNSGIPGTGTEVYYGVNDKKSKELAQEIQNNIVALGFADRGIKTKVATSGKDYSGIIRLTNAPAVLVEMAFINNPKDMKRFNVKTISQVIANGIMKVFPIKKDTVSNVKVQAIQRLLNNYYGFGLATDGIYGPKMKTALIRALQFEVGIRRDGIFGNKTRNNSPTLGVGSRGNIVYLVQAALVVQGYIENGLDGIYGCCTEKEVRSFQAVNGLDADGIAGKSTFEKLFA